MKQECKNYIFLIIYTQFTHSPLLAAIRWGRSPSWPWSPWQQQPLHPGIPSDPLLEQVPQHLLVGLGSPEHQGVVVDTWRLGPIHPSVHSSSSLLWLLEGGSSQVVVACRLHRTKNRPVLTSADREEGRDTHAQSSTWRIHQPQTFRHDCLFVYLSFWAGDPST